METRRDTGYNELIKMRARDDMRELKNKINFTVAGVGEFAQKKNLSGGEAFQGVFQFKGIEFIKENYKEMYFKWRELAKTGYYGE